jgi:hypothetical protein
MVVGKCGLQTKPPGGFVDSPDLPLADEDLPRQAPYAALRAAKPGLSLDLPPLRGGFRSLSVAAIYCAAEYANVLRTSIQSPTNS